MFSEIVTSIILAVIPWLLFWNSRRFRVTFRHELRDDDPLLRR
jgi:hypothetical protein